MSNIQVSIKKAARSYKKPNGSPGSWDYGKTRILAAQQGGQEKYIYCSVLECVFPKISFQRLEKLTLILNYDKWAAESTSVVLFSKKLSPKEVFNLDENVVEMDGYISQNRSFAEKTELNPETQIGTIKWEIPFDDSSSAQSKLQNLFGANKGTEFYIYIKRQLGKAEQPSSYYTSLLNPVYNKVEDTESLTLSYTDNDYYLSPSTFIVSGMGDVEKKFDIYKKSTDDGSDQLMTKDQIIAEFGSLTWQSKPQLSNITATEDGVFTFEYPFTPGQVEIIAQLGVEGAITLSSIITFPTKWAGLKSWLAGYAIKMMGSFIPPLAITAYQYEGNIILPAFIPYSFSEEAAEGSSICIARDPILDGVYYFYIAPKGSYIYNTQRNLVYSEGVALVYKTDKKSKGWTLDGIKHDFYIEPLWSSEDIKDLEGNIKIKTYKPAPMYGEEGLKWLNS